PTTLSRATVDAVERLYNQVLDATILDARQRLTHLNASDTIDRQYFENLDTVTDHEDYYNAAYFIFASINSQLLAQQEPDKLLEEVLPGEKAAIRGFFTKVGPHLTRYLTTSGQNKPELMANVTRWAGETEDALVRFYLEFPRNLQGQLPELQMMDYTKMAQVFFAGLFNSIF
ncbi:hypothetical protein KR018_009980, partial [Drosophila ironensis]